MNDEAPETPTLTGSLLVAGPGLYDPNFLRTVVLICRHDSDGALGLILNRRTDIAVGDHLPGWTEALTAPDVVFVGGPVEPQVAIGLGRRRHSSEPPGWTPVSSDLGLVDLSEAPGLVTGHLDRLRVFSGYAGWSAGQLDFEASSGDWLLVDAEPDDPFGEDVDNLWHDVLRRQDGELRLYADFPLDPSAN